MADGTSDRTCLEPELLLAQVEREDAAVLEHVATCPRCRSLVAAFRDFASPDPATFAPRQGEAEDMLARFLAGEFGSDAARVPERRGGKTVIGEVLSAMMRSRFAWVATAAVVLAVSALVWQGGRERPRAPILLRRGATATSTIDERVVTEPPHLRRDGGLELRWRPFEGAEAYQVVLLAPGTLEEVLRPAPVSTTSAVLSAAELGPVAQGGRPLLWQVVALAGGDTLATSRAAVLEIPSDR